MHNFVKYLITILTGIVLVSCSKPIFLKNMGSDKSGYFMFGRIPERNFYNEVSITENLELLWKAQTHGSHGNTSVIIYNDHLLIGDLSGRIYVFEKNTGKLIGYEKFNGSISVSPVLYKLRFYFVLNDKEEFYSRFIVFDFINGKILSEDKIQGSVSNELIRLEDGVIVYSDNGEIIKYNYAGIRDWTTQTKTTALSSPCSDGDFIYCANSKGELIFVNSTNGEIEFREKISDQIGGGIAFDSGNLFFGNNFGELFSFNVITKKSNWFFSTGAKIISTPVYDNQKIIVGNLAGNIYALDKSSGKKMWRIDTKGIFNTTPILTKTLLIQPNINKKLYLINPHIGTVVNSIEFESRMKLSPVIFEDVLYLGSDRGQIFAYKINKAE
jgi:outer membrane protein assembly factor BamB